MNWELKELMVMMEWVQQLVYLHQEQGGRLPLINGDHGDADEYDTLYV